MTARKRKGSAALLRSELLESARLLREANVDNGWLRDRAASVERELKGLRARMEHCHGELIAERADLAARIQAIDVKLNTLGVTRTNRGSSPSISYFPDASELFGPA